MMKTPTLFEIEQLLHAADYDPVKAHEYYLRTRKLKGRQAAAVEAAKTKIPKGPVKGLGRDPRTGKTKEEITRNAKARQRKELSERIKSLQVKLRKLEDKIREMVREEASEDRKSKAKKERAAKEAAKPDTAAEKAEKARDAEKYRDKNQQKLKNKASDSSSSSGGSKSSGSSKKPGSVDDLRALAVKVTGQIEAAKMKLSAL